MLKIKHVSELLNGRQTKSPLDVQDAGQISWPNQSDKGATPDAKLTDAGGNLARGHLG
jgi:hypothetical protein